LSAQDALEVWGGALGHRGPEGLSEGAFRAAD